MSGSDFSAAPLTVNFPPGVRDSDRRCGNIIIVDDDAAEPTEYFIVKLTSDHPVHESAIRTTIEVIDDDG